MFEIMNTAFSSLRIFRILQTLLLPTIIVPQAVFTTRAAAAEPFAVPTFHSLGVYWSPEGGSAARPVAVSYRKQGDATWRQALPMRYNPIAGTDEDRADYRGSIVNLTPNTRYEIRLRLQEAKTTTTSSTATPPAASLAAANSAVANLVASTWNEDFPIGATQKVASQEATLQITQSGTPTAYRLYDGTNMTINAGHNADNCITVNASYVILRGFTLKGAGSASSKTGGYAGAIRIEDGHDIVIERCDISDWGRPAKTPLMPNQGRNMDCGVNCSNTSVTRVVIQRCRIHHPHYDTNHWYEPVKNSHPAGPQCVSFIESAGNHVIRYNEFYSDADHYYNDIIGGGKNASHRGCPGPDTDIYCNTFSHCWDDAIEVEGSDANVRVWGNYITEAMMGLGNAPVTIGPLYFWRNVMNRSQWYPDGPGGQFIKMGFATGEEWMTGHIYLFHNTIFQEDQRGCVQGIGGKNRIMKHTMSRNNILHLRSSDGASISSNLQTPDNDFDYDLYNGSVPDGHESHGVKGAPRYVSGAEFDPKAMQGNFQLAPNSPGLDAGEAIPNFSDGFTGKAPDIGAHESGWRPMQYGINAVFQPGGKKTRP
ncbi:MAG: right-handed parallel beta-helix repeat-containing protein [Candidatus Sumerlaeota bacterium]|nr:right-handed parallel beta-helix repeat-containing protein [Candidatus Sumerlaeota bacterium]